MGHKKVSRSRDSADRLSRELVKIQAGVLALVCAVISGLVIFGMTAWLLIKDGPNVGMHLNLLGNYFIGYSVTWSGSLVGLLYGLLVGGAVGWSIAKVYNGVVAIRQRHETPRRA
jgi:hypothetical protein